MIGLAVPDLSVPYFSELAGAVIRYAQQHGLIVVVEQTDGDAAREHALLDAGAQGALVDGVILNPLTMSSQEVADRAESMPVVLLGERESMHRLDHVAVDNVAAARVATEHLISLQPRRIAAIGYQDDVRLQTAHLRARGYEQALVGAGLDVDPALCVRVKDYHRHDGAEAMRRLLDLADPPDAVFCFNDLLALGALRTASSEGLRIPRDLAIVGFDDIEDGRYSSPRLTTIRPDKDEIARIAVRMLFDRIAGTPGKPREHLAPFSLEVRESTTGTRRRRTHAAASG
jgi:DNA-binding LacI/PurR family transcriptional regulator